MAAGGTGCPGLRKWERVGDSSKGNSGPGLRPRARAGFSALASLNFKSPIFLILKGVITEKLENVNE